MSVAARFVGHPNVLLRFDLYRRCLKLWNQGSQQACREPGTNAIIEGDNNRIAEAIGTLDVWSILGFCYLVAVLSRNTGRLHASYCRPATPREVSGSRERTVLLLPKQNSNGTEHNFINSILQSLGSDARSRLHLRPVNLDVPRQLEAPGTAINHLIFPEQGAASMTTTFLDGTQVEVGLFGYESVIGASALMGTKQSLNRIYMQIAGNGFVASMDDARREFLRGEHFQRLTLAFVQAQLIQVAQSAGCNAKHSVEQRLARWLLTCADRSRSTTFTVSQEFIATMLGIRRMSASGALADFKSARIIATQRNQISIVDRQTLEMKACECYAVVRHHLDSYAEFDSSVSKPV